MAETNGNQNTRLDRIEKVLEMFVADHEQFRQEHKQLLIAQVVQSDQIAENTRSIGLLTQTMDALTERMDKDRMERKEKDEVLDKRVDDLVLAIGSLIARIPPHCPGLRRILHENPHKPINSVMLKGSSARIRPLI